VLPYPSVWPFVLGLGLTMALTGLVFGFWVLIVGVALATVAAVGWQRAVNREQRYGRLGRVQASDGEWRPPVR
jgi:hypothetical protein